MGTNYTVTKARPNKLFSFSKLGQELHAELPNLENVTFDLDTIQSALDLPRLNSLTVAENA